METLMLAWVVTYLVHSTILVLGAWLLERRWADRPERMSGVWKTALVGGLLTASLQTGLGVSPVAGQWALQSNSIPASGQEPTAGAAALPAPAVELVPTAVVRDAPMVLASWPPPDAAFSVEPVLAPELVVEPETVPGTVPETVMVESIVSEPTPELDEEDGVALAATVEASEPFSSVRPWVLGLLGLGALAGALSVLMAFLALRRELRGRRMLREGSLPVLLERLRRRAGTERRVTLTEAPHVRVPMAVGVARPEIVVPARIADELSIAHQETLLAHELAHVLRRDPTWRLIALCMERVLFFQPLNRLASRRLSQYAEYLCDDWAADHTRQPLALASCLTEIATWVARPGPVAATMAGPRSILGRRVHRLLQPASSRGRPWWLASALVLPLLGVVLVAPGVSASTGSQPEARVVVIDDDGRRHELVARDGEVVMMDDDGAPVVVRMDDAEAVAVEEAERSPRGRAARRAERDHRREAERSRRRARKELRKAFRDAKRRGEAAPSDREVQAILDRARPPAPSRRGHREPGERDGHVQLHLVVPGEVELHGRVPIDLEALEQLEVLEVLEGLEGLEVLEGLEGLEQLEDLEPVLEILEDIEAGELDLVLQGDDGETLHVVVESDEAEALREHHQAQAQARLGEAMRRRALVEHERAQREHQRRRAKHEREIERRHEQAARELSRRQAESERDRRHWREEQARDAERRAKEIEREVERVRRRMERRAPAPAPPAPPQAPFVLRRVPAPPLPPTAPEAPVVMRRDEPCSSRTPAPPAPSEAPVVWVSRPS